MLAGLWGKRAGSCQAVPCMAESLRQWVHPSRISHGMSRHSKWAKIKHEKTATDAKRGQLFTKLVRTITVAAREGGENPEANPQLRWEIDRALAANMPKENIQRAIERAAGPQAEEGSTAFTLEGFGPGGAALLIEAVTDNRNRTVADMRSLLSAVGGTLGQSGSVSWQFERRGVLVVEEAADPDMVELAAIDAGAAEIAREGRSLDIITAPEKLKAVEAELRARGVTPTSAQISYRPKQLLDLNPATFERLAELIGELEGRPDVVEVTTNAAPPETA